MKTSLIYLALFIFGLGQLNAQNSGLAGAYTRLGYGARGMGMGNALTSVSEGQIQTYYNPSLAAFSEQRTGALTTSFLAFDRRLNFLSYTQAVEPTAGISAGLIASGMKNIESYDGSGNFIENLSTFDDEFYLAFSNRMTEDFSLGVSVKLYYAKLYEEMSTTTVGFDLGAFYRVTPELGVGAVIQDVSTKYKWDSKPLYDTDGKLTTDKFPQLRRIGVSYAPESKIGLVAIDFENSSEGTNMVKIGAEYNLMPSDSSSFNFTIRGGVDRWVLGSDNTPGAKPTFGFTLNHVSTNLTPSITYAYVIEPFSTQGMHLITLSAMF
jgi:hypothetical protein